MKFIKQVKESKKVNENVPIAVKLNFSNKLQNVAYAFSLHQECYIKLCSCSMVWLNLICFLVLIGLWDLFSQEILQLGLVGPSLLEIAN